METETIAQIPAWHQRILNGAKFMDFQLPSWAQKIDLTTFDIDSPTQCVLGQIFGSYHEGRFALALTHEALIEYGFYPAAGESYYAPAEVKNEEITKLLEEKNFVWTEQIRRRQTSIKEAILMNDSQHSEEI